MASQAVRALIVEKRSIRCAPLRSPRLRGRASVNREAVFGRAPKRGGRIGLWLAALLALFACASVHGAASARALSALPAAGAFSCVDVGAALGAAVPEPEHYHQGEPGHYQQNGESPPGCELDALEPEDSEEDGGRDAHAPILCVSFAPVAPAGRQPLPPATALRPAQFVGCSALPRGPPCAQR